MTKPITPDKVKQAQEAKIPDEVIEVFNDLIIENWDGNFARFRQEEVTGRIGEQLNITNQEVYKRKLLNIENVYKRAGWTVRYDAGDAFHQDPATFTFSKLHKNQSVGDKIYE